MNFDSRLVYDEVRTKNLLTSLCVCVHVYRGSMSSNLFATASYIYMNAFILAFGMWAMIAADSVDAILMVSCH